MYHHDNDYWTFFPYQHNQGELNVSTNTRQNYHGTIWEVYSEGKLVGNLSLQQEGTRLYGYYTWGGGNGRIRGTLSASGTVWTATWSDGPTFQCPWDRGLIAIVFQEDQFNGRWNYCDETDMVRGINGKKISSPGAP